MQIADKWHCLENKDKGWGGRGALRHIQLRQFFSNVINLQLTEFMDAELTAFYQRVTAYSNPVHACIHGSSYGTGAWKYVSQTIWRHMIPFLSLGLPDGETTESASGIWPGAIQESSRRASEPWQWTKAQVWAQPSLSDRPAQCSLFLSGLPCWPGQVLPHPEPPEVSLF